MTVYDITISFLISYFFSKVLVLITNVIAFKFQKLDVPFNIRYTDDTYTLYSCTLTYQTILYFMLTDQRN